MRKLLILLFTCFTLIVNSQYSNVNWVFGNYAGLNFNQIIGGYPSAFSGSQVFTEEGVACISDENGNLLFYTDGWNLWDYNHVLKSSTLKGDNSSTQSAIIVPNPSLFNNSRNYYVFTVDAWGACSWTNTAGDGIYYSIVNVDFNLPYTVTIVQENIPLAPQISFRENLMAVSKQTSPGYWVISKQYAINNTTGSNAFYVWEVTSAGVDTIPQIYNVGSIQNPSGAIPGSGNESGSIGYLKISHDGSMLAIANNKDNTVELYRFNVITGAVLPYTTTGNTVLTNIVRAYGLEFSPNNQYLYVTRTYNGVIQKYDLTSTNIASSVVSLTPTIVGNYYILSALQLGPDNKIYCVKYNWDKLAVINDPNASGNTCTLIDNAVQLTAGTKGRNGLPTFVPTKIQNVNLTEILKNDDIIIYPNPTSDIVNIDYPSTYKLQIRITNTDGKTVFERECAYKQHQINIENLPNGVYFAQIILTDNNCNSCIKTVARKLIKV